MKVFKKPKLKPIQFIVSAVVAFIACMVFFPSAVFDASKTGVKAWWNIVFPALLPFFISSELLMGYGVVKFMGVLLEPVMRPLFNLPGAASFVMAVGYTSGFPISASLAAQLRKDRLCTRIEGERIMSFTNNASPLFMLVAVGVGMLGNPKLGIIIAISHYAANLIIGIALRFYCVKDPEYVPNISPRDNLFRQAMMEMKKSYWKNPRPFGKMLGDAITSSMNKLLVIGGFVIIFSVIIRVSVITGIMSVITKMIGNLVIPFAFKDAIVKALSWGFFEITLGAKAAAEVAAPLVEKATAVSIILGWSGVSVLAQVAAMINETDLKIGLFIVCRFFHAVISGMICYLSLSSRLISEWMTATVSTIGVADYYPASFFNNLLLFSRLCLYTVIAWFLCGMITYFIHSLRIIRFKA